jgi:hypothetical protein
VENMQERKYTVNSSSFRTKNVLHFCNEENLKASKFQRYMLIPVKSKLPLDRAIAREAKAADKTEWTVKIQKKVGEACFSLYLDFTCINKRGTSNGQCREELSLLSSSIVQQSKLSPRILKYFLQPPSNLYVHI